MPQRPPMDPNTDEASETQLELARNQGEAFRAALDHMIEEVAQTGVKKEVGDYVVAIAIEKAEGLYSLSGDELTWNEPDTENAHIEVAVSDASDGRLVPGLDVSVTVTAPDGKVLGPYSQDLVWHPMIYHYARNWTLPGDGTYSVKVEFDAPTFHRHDKVNGKRFTEPVSVVFNGVDIETGTG